MTSGGTSVTPGDRIADRYLVEAWLGQGHMAIVYRARHQGTGKACALKVVHPHLASRREIVDLFVREAQVGALIGPSPFIVNVFDAGVDPQRALPFLAMDLLHGKPLDQHVEEHGALEASLVRLLFEQLAEALDQAHGAGVIHRDLKPSNLFLTRDKKGQPVLKVVDFGIAKVLEHEAQRTATQVGSPAYASPEQLGQSLRKLAARQGITIAQGISPASDVWAMGLIAYELLTGHTPAQYWNQFETLSDLIMRIALEDVEPATVRAGPRALLLPYGFDGWFARCLQKNAADRWPSAGECARALVELIDSAGTDNLQTVKLPLRNMLVTAPMAPGPSPHPLPDTIKLPPEMIKGFSATPPPSPPPPAPEPSPRVAARASPTEAAPWRQPRDAPPQAPPAAPTETQPPGLLPADAGVAGTKPRDVKRSKSAAVAVYGAIIAAALLLGVVLLVAWPRSGALRIEVRSEQGDPVPSAEIFIDGQKRCATAPCVVADLSPGTKTIKVLTDDTAATGQLEETVEAGQEKTITITLRTAVAASPPAAPAQAEAAPPLDTQVPHDGGTTPLAENNGNDDGAITANPSGTGSSPITPQGAQGSAQATVAYLSVNSAPVSKVLLDGRPLGSTPKVGHIVKPGNHTIEFVHASLGRKRVQVKINPGERKVVAIKF